MNANQIDNLGGNGQIPIRYKLMQLYQEKIECLNRPMTKRLNNNSVSWAIVSLIVQCLSYVIKKPLVKLKMWVSFSKTF